ncbi:hypothetical protein ACJMK2_034837 [Sinanodonta woodiana]|uniref:Uncharacterized protein n=1 Tax=Sinanodonta woodiana TaxID=1069815 RepID=A0ABD3WSX4_SINWO
MAYNQTYADKTSPQFQNLAKTFIISLTEVFKTIEGFKSIDILGFSKGSVRVNYAVNVFGTVDVAKVTDEISSSIVSSLTSIAGVPINTTYTHDSMKQKLEIMKTRDKCSLASTSLCPFGYYCKPAIGSTSVILCIDRCNSSVCQNNGECYIGHHSDDAQCRCGFSENVVYSGQRCEIKTEVVTVQERNLYLIIAGAIIGGILVVFISMVYVINRKRNHLKKRLTISHVLQLDEMRKRSNNDVPAMDDRYVISLNPALRRYPEGYSGGRVNVSYQDQGLDGGYLQVRDCDRRNSDEDYDYIGPEFESYSKETQHSTVCKT